jgi:hypothetical protein
VARLLHDVALDRDARGQTRNNGKRAESQTGGVGELSELAYYYPEPYWLAHEGSWIKSLLLFFDGVAILLPAPAVTSS